MNFIKLFTAILLLFSQLLASGNFDIAIELSRSARVEKTIKNINQIAKFTNSYILKTADLSVTKQKLQNYFQLSSQIWKNPYNKDILFSCDTTQKRIIFSNLLSKDATKLQKKFLTNSINLPKNSYLEPKNNYTLSVPLNSKTSKFIELVKSIGALKQGDISYIPDGKGGLIVFKGKKRYGKIDPDNKEAITAYSLNELEQIKAQKGSVGYVINDKNEAIKYIYNGTKWISLVGEGGIKTTSTCSAKTLGALRYSEKDSCTQYCSYTQGSYKWRCYNKTTPLPPVITDVQITDDKITLSGKTTMKNSTITLYDNSSELNSTKSDKSGNFSFTVANLSSGTHSISLKATLDSKKSPLSNPYKIIIGDDKDEEFIYEDSMIYIDGKDGADSVRFDKSYSNYSIKKLDNNTYQITHANKSVILKDIQTLRFSDKEITFGVEDIDVGDDLYYYL